MSNQLTMSTEHESSLLDNTSSSTVGKSTTKDQFEKTPVEQNDLPQIEAETETKTKKKNKNKNKKKNKTNTNTKTESTPKLNDTEMESSNENENENESTSLSFNTKTPAKSSLQMDLPNESQDTFQSAFEDESDLNNESGIISTDPDSNDHPHKSTDSKDEDEDEEDDFNNITLEAIPAKRVEEQCKNNINISNDTETYSSEATPIVETFDKKDVEIEQEDASLEKVKTLEEINDNVCISSIKQTQEDSKVPTLTTTTATINNEIGNINHTDDKELDRDQESEFDDSKAFTTSPVPMPTESEVDDPDQHPLKTVTHLKSGNESVTSLNSGQQSISSHLPGFKKWFTFSKSANNSAENLFTFKQLTKNVQYNLLYSRFQTNEQDFQSKSPKDQDFVLASANSLRKTFNEIKTGIEYSNDEMLIQGIDWEFWSKVVNDYSTVVTKDSDELLRHITIGIPRELRGMVWQLICNSKSFVLEEFFRDGRLQSSDFESQIKRDLARTSFVTDSAVKAKADDLFDIIKAYSLYDMEVGYTQGMAFITVPLLMNMDASEAFCMLTKVMKNYGFRELYLPEMPGLHLKLYQFDRLIEDLLPDLHLHLRRQGVRSSMYATQWFLTLFGYKFPLDMVLRIYDVVIVEGIESILKFAVNLMTKNETALLDLKFDDLVTFLKDKLFFYYIENSGASSTKDGTITFPRGLPDAYTNKQITSDTYRLDEFVKDSMAIEILPMTLLRYSSEYEEVNRLEKERREEIEEMRSKNGYLTREIRTIEAAYATLNREHVEIANEMVQGKVQIATLQDENKELNDQIKEMTNRLQNLETQSDTQIDFTGEISDNMGLEIQKTMQRNLEVMEENRNLEDALAALELQYGELKKELENVKKTGKWGVKTFW